MSERNRFKRAQMVKAHVAAFLKVARQQDAFDTIACEFERLSDILAKNGDLRRKLTGARVDPDDKTAAITAVCTELDFGELMQNFMKVMSDEDNLDLLPDVVRGILAETREEVVLAKVTTAYPLDDAQKARLKGVLSEKFNKRVQMKVEEDPKLIGGLRVQVNDTVIDGSVRNKLDRLKKELNDPSKWKF